MEATEREDEQKKQRQDAFNFDNVKYDAYEKKKQRTDRAQENKKKNLEVINENSREEET